MSPSVAAPTAALLNAPQKMLRFLSSDPPRVALRAFSVLELWAVVGLGALVRPAGPTRPALEFGADGTSQFALAMGLRDIERGTRPAPPLQPERTVRLESVGPRQPTEPLAGDLARLMAGEAHEDVRKTLYYVLNELLRNALQHSRDPLGCVAGAQLNRGGRHQGKPTIQVAVADAGIGILESLRSRHRDLADVNSALDRALQPHVSSAFDLGASGSLYNAGLGLFFVSEMAKLVGGRLVIATRGGGLMLVSEYVEEEGHGKLEVFASSDQFPGTLVAFEMPAEEPQVYDEMLQTIHQRAEQRRPRRDHHRWLQFTEPPPEAFRVLVREAHLEDAREAADYAARHLEPRLVKREPVTLDFSGVKMVTQSYVHALLYEAVRLAWARQAPLYVVNATPAVRSSLEFLQNYALGG